MILNLSISGGVMVCKQDQQIFTSEFESHWVSNSFGLVRHRSKKLRKLQHGEELCASDGVMVSKLD